MAGLWVALLQAQGLPSAVGPLVVAALVVLCAWLARSRASFAPESLIDEGLLAVGALAMTAVALPSILDGWQTAVALSKKRTMDGPCRAQPWPARQIPMGSSLASMATGNLKAMAGQMVVAFTSTIIGLATGTSPTWWRPSGTTGSTKRSATSGSSRNAWPWNSRATHCRSLLVAWRQRRRRQL